MCGSETNSKPESYSLLPEPSCSTYCLAACFPSCHQACILSCVWIIVCCTCLPLSSSSVHSHFKSINSTCLIALASQELSLRLVYIEARHFDGSRLVLYSITCSMQIIGDILLVLFLNVSSDGVTYEIFPPNKEIACCFCGEQSVLGKFSRCKQMFLYFV